MSRAELHVVLCVPRVQLGVLTLGGFSGLDQVLKPHQRGPSQTTGSSTRYPLRLPDGRSFSAPMTLPMIGETAIGLGYAQGSLWLGLPNLPMVLSFLRPHLVLRPGVAPRLHQGTVFYPLSAKAGDRVAIPIPSLGEVAIEVEA